MCNTGAAYSHNAPSLLPLENKIKNIHKIIPLIYIVHIADHGRLSPQDHEIENQRTIKARSLSLDSRSRYRVVDPAPSGWTRTVLKLLGYYGKQSRLIRGANTLYSRISSQVNQPELYASESYFMLKISVVMLLYADIHGS